MGMQMNTIAADKVIIMTPEKKIIIENPQVTKIRAMGQETFQISGDISEESKEKFSKDDIKMIMAKTGALEEDAIKALENTNDIAEAIVQLKKSKNN